MTPTRAAAVATLALLVATAGPALAAAAVVGETAAFPKRMRYVVRPGDTLLGLAGFALLRRADWREVARINGISNPGEMTAGQVLSIPAPMLRREAMTAEIAAFSGDVTIEPGGEARLGLKVGAGAIVGTGANSFVTLRLSDNSRVTLPSQSQVRIVTLDRLAIDGRLDRRFELLSGRADFSVTPRQRREDRMLVKTPVAVAAVRGTRFRVTHDAAAGNTLIGVVEGEVMSRPDTMPGETAVAAGSGAVLGRDSARTAALLPPPVLLRPGKVQEEPAVVFEMAPAGTQATRRQVKLARDAGFIDRFAETETTGNEARFENVGNGTLFVRLTGVDRDGVEGLPADYAFERFAMGLETSSEPVPGITGPRQTLFRWRPSGAGLRSYDFVLARDADLKDRIVDAPGLDGTEMTIVGLRSGTWFWRVTATARDGDRRHRRVFPVRTLTIARAER